jgi:hypothetical protein
VPPAAPGSRGDAALVAVAAARLRRDGVRLSVGEFPGEHRWAADTPTDASVELSDWFGRGDAQGLLRAGIALGWRLGATDALFLLGADVLDGHYSEPGSVRRLALLELAARTGAETTVVGAS